MESKKAKSNAGQRVFISLMTGLLLGLLTIYFGGFKFAPIFGWDGAAITYLILVWPIIWPQDSSETKNNAKLEDPSNNTAHGILMTAASASIVAAGIILTHDTNGNAGQEVSLALLAIASVVLSWLVVHTIYTLNYAALYYSDPEGGVDFNQTEKPNYSDFAYLAFTIGMTFQVSDTIFKNRRFRKAALVHAIFSYVFGTVIVATTINLVAGLSK